MNIALKQLPWAPPWITSWFTPASPGSWSFPERTFYVDGAVVNFIPRIPTLEDGSEVPSMVIRAQRITSVGPRMPQGVSAFSPYAWQRWFVSWSNLFTVGLDYTYQDLEVTCPLAPDRREVSAEHLIFEISDKNCPFPRPAGLNTGARPHVYQAMYLWGQEVARKIIDEAEAAGTLKKYMRGKHIRSLVIAAGGVNVFFFLGVIKEFQRRGWTADRISTCSAGGPTGATFACGVDADLVVAKLLKMIEHRMELDALAGSVEFCNLQRLVSSWFTLDWEGLVDETLKSWQKYVLSGGTGWSPSQSYVELCEQFGFDWPEGIDFEMQACQITLAPGQVASAWTLSQCKPKAVYYNRYSGITFAEALTRSGSAPGLARPREETDSA
jgi:predicted acylesterase/phospholipase RssA